VRRERRATGGVLTGGGDETAKEDTVKPGALFEHEGL